MDITFQPDAILSLAGIVLSLVFGYLPMLKTWYDGVNPVYRPLLMAGVLLLITVGKLVAECGGSFACMGVNWQAAFWGWFGALIANQTTFMIAVKQPRQERMDAAYFAGLDAQINDVDPCAEDGK
jgi:hypothetical protein